MVINRIYVMDTALFSQNGNCGSVLKNNIWELEFK
jgi:hypothetical protein